MNRETTPATYLRELVAISWSHRGELTAAVIWAIAVVIATLGIRSQLALPRLLLVLLPAIVAVLLLETGAAAWRLHRRQEVSLATRQSLLDLNAADRAELEHRLRSRYQRRASNRLISAEDLSEEELTVKEEKMKVLLAMSLVLVVAQGANAQARNESDLEIAIRASMREVVQVSKDMVLIDESSKKLAISNQAQADTTEMVNKQARKLEYEDAPAINKRIDEIQERARQLLASGCAADTTTDPDLARRCNAANDEMAKERDAIKADQESLAKKAAWIGEMRNAVTNTTLKNAAQQKKNNADYNDLSAKKLALFQDVITRSLSIVERRAAAIKTCAALENPENTHCCLSVVNDGKPASACDMGIEALYNQFKNGGVFPNP